MIGQTLGHYRIEAKLGGGGMGVVYKAHDTHLDRPVAIKVLSAEAVSDAERKRRFVQEARMASALNHPNILHIYDIDQSNGIDFIAMEFVPGQTMGRLIGPKGLPIVEVLQYAVQIASALARAHAAGIVHRDIKPANLMVADEGLVKVLDFGVAKLTEPIEEIPDSEPTRTMRITSSPRTEAGMIVGTIAYMSPEQAEGKKVDARSDIFSFGSVLYEMVTGQRPFGGDSKLATLSAILSKEPKPLGELVELAPPELDQIVRRCLHKEPASRFQDMSDLKAALDQLKESVRGPSTAGLRRPATAPPARISSRRKWAVAVAGMSLILAIAAGLREELSDALHLGRRPGEKLAAVLGFQCGGSDPAGQAFCEGLVEMLSRKLCSLNQFQRGPRVLPPGDVRGDPGRGASEARKTAGISTALTGTVARADGKVRLTATVVDTRTMREVRRLEMESPLHDLSALQDGLVKKVAKILDLRLSPEAEQVLAAGNTTVAEAYDLCLQAHGYLQHPNRGEDLERAIGLFQQAIEKDPSYGLAHAGLGESYWAKSALTKDQQWAEKARQSCRRAIALKADLPEVHILLGKTHAGTGRPREAVAEFQRARQLDRLSTEACIRLGAAYEATGRLDEAESTYRGLIELWPNYYVPYSQLAAYCVRQGRYSDGELLFRKVVELAPENPSGYQNLGAVYHYLGRPTDAAAMMKKALAIKPTARGYSNLGTLYFFQGHYSDAVPLMEKAVEMDQDNYMYMGNLGDAYRWAPESRARAPEAYRRAIQLAEQESAMNPNDADIRSSVAVYYAKLPDRAKALAEIARARRLAPMNPKVLFKSALAYEIIGRRDSAIGALDLALQSGYSIEEVRREPELTELRKDPRYQQLGGAAPARPKGK